MENCVEQKPEMKMEAPAAAVGDQKIAPDELTAESLKPKCSCSTPKMDYIPYSHMGHAKDLDSLRKTFTQSCGVPGSKIRIVEIEKVCCG